MSHPVFVLHSAIVRPEGGNPHAIVLAFLPDNTVTPWVTWLRIFPKEGAMDREPFTVSGGYFAPDQLPEAVADWCERSRNIGVEPVTISVAAHPWAGAKGRLVKRIRMTP